ncbi:uncharacterized protein YbbC (DUF1343 family) [Krasilnikovia cinnamomea]|uniref:Uncharacterized protein YbbC (DUF1343 family) n=1 Tax=Krasilnikovia cinnamomea TaxID=349313 RepID=A0A4Q7ZSB7_9ACTN|nr:DUF1343 domain-containing protein [Krasilnikovia cinnamomea]RZU53744.1 uncharacterized protein YbbC (DUF1343 family) [Krasilnikovia cinnamomea]
MDRRRLLALSGGAAALAVGPAPAVAARSPRPVRTGLDRLAATGWAMLTGTRVGIISNPTGVDRHYRHLVDLMHADGRVDIAGVFGPEHGFRGSAQAGGSEGTGVDARTGLTVYDAYGADPGRWAALYSRAGVRTVVFDIQDVGARFYTYIWTLYDSMVAAARAGLRYVVLDRPNPIGGRAYGPVLDPAYASGVGRKPIAQQHGMTVGELARLFNGEFVGADAGRTVALEVVACRGWVPGTGAFGAPWVLPSPNMPTLDTALVYPGTAMFEGVATITEGRGTTRPFELVGGPGLDHHWGDRLNAAGLGGVRFREAYFTPTAGRFAGTLCAGVEVRVSDRWAFDPVRTGVAMLVEARRYPHFAWRVDAGAYWIDKLTGSDRLRAMVDAGAGADEAVAAWGAELAAFEARRRPYLLYRRPR